MAKDKESTPIARRAPARRQGAHLSGNGPRRGRVPGAAGRRRSGRVYQSTATALLPRLRLQTLELTPSRVMALSLLVGTLALLLWFFVDESFYVYAAQVRGNSLVSADEVYRAGGLHSMSIFFIDRERVAREIERCIPGVAQARVQCELPGRVSVRISEQDVRYIWRNAGAAYLVDGEGNVLKADDGTHSDLLVIQDLDSRPLQPGDFVERAALTAVGRLHALLPEVRVFEYSTAKGVSLSDARGWRVYFGAAEELEEKVATLQALLQRLAQEHKTVKTIDLSILASPYYR